MQVLGGTLIVTKATPIRITVSLKPGDYAGQDADWWVYGGTSEYGEYSFIYGTGWRSGKHLSYRGRIFDLASFTVADGKLPVGNYLITFAIDNNADGRRDNTWKDSIRIIVTQ